MKAVVVYESVYGNTREIAEAVAEGLRDGAEVEVSSVAGASPSVVRGAGLLVVGGPTHLHGMASHMSMKAAFQDTKKKPDVHLEPDVDGPVLRDWFEELPNGQHVPAAAFDTRLGKPRFITGSAAKGIAHRLSRHGYELVSDPESFIVDATHGDKVLEGELERAREWGRSLVTSAEGRR